MKPSTKPSESSKPTSRLVASVAIVVAAAALAAGTIGAGTAQTPTNLAVPAGGGGCDDWGCGMNHNEVMATTLV